MTNGTCSLLYADVSGLFSLIQDERGETPLHAASSQGQVKVISVLVQRGAKLNPLNKVGWVLSLCP